MPNDRDHDDLVSLPPEVAAALKAASAPASDTELAGAEAAGIKLAAVTRSQGSVRGAKGLTGMWSGIRRRVPNVVLGVIIGSMVGGGAFAVAQTVGDHGGPKPRYHNKNVCNLVDTSKLPGNWTHGDYVSAVEKQDPAKVREAAQSDCGKPIKGAKGNNGRGKGPKPEKTKEPKAPESAKPNAPATKKPSASPSPKPSASETVTASPSPAATASPTASITTPST